MRKLRKARRLSRLVVKYLSWQRQQREIVDLGSGSLAEKESGSNQSLVARQCLTDILVTDFLAQ